MKNRLDPGGAPTGRLARTLLPCLAPILAPILVAQEVAAQCGTFTEVEALVGGDLGSGDNLGRSLAADGDTVLGGVVTTSKRAVYAFRRTNGVWSQETKLVSPLPDVCSFGHAVALDGDVAVVGDYGYETGGFCTGFGAAFVYRRTGTQWQLEKQLFGSLFRVGYGYSLALRGDKLLVGVTGQNSPNFSDPEVVFHRYVEGTWGPRQPFTAADTQRGDFFGSAIALSQDGNLAVIGASKADVGVESGAGAAYVFAFDGSTWVEQQKLTASDAGATDAFGSSVALRGNTIAVGAPKDDAQFVDAGSVYVFRFDGSQWSQTQNFAASQQAQGQRFGVSVALDAGQLAVGAFGTDTVQLYNDTGGAFLPVETLRPSSGAVEWAGYSVALARGRAFVGAPFADAVGQDSGVVYRFRALDLALARGPGEVHAGANVTLTTCGGAPGARNVVALWSQRGTLPFGSPVYGLLGPFVGIFLDGKHSVTFRVPLALAGRTLRFQAIGSLGSGARARSNVLAFPVN